MRLLLVGCSGFIGRELIPHLLKSGYLLTVISRKAPKKYPKSIDTTKLNHLQLDPAELINWEQDKLLCALKEANGVINLAGEPIANKRWTEEQCKKIEQSRLITTKGLVNAMSQINKPPEILINASAIGFYGTSQNKIFTEKSSQGDDFLASLCSKWEQISRGCPQQTRLVLIRIGIVLGRDGGALGKMLPIFRAGFGGPIGNGNQWMSWIHRKDLCQIIEKSLRNKKWEGVINAVSPNPAQMSLFSQTLGEVLGRPSLLPLPAPLLKLLLGDGAKVVLEGQKVIPERLMKMNFEYKYPELKQALENLTE
ncbi:TIGR01777 family oxidoreductase [Prochlorococcus sp. MIT 1223]|uniref:TIGR01777 family oxidoreductase n=1 Tax=Prochlorococcus sp. MIT 1223 TaxID=3096217 RepID=UPI002A755EE1|nr:TIGR01777 family oxidoreductase [Prochlorococcus sp. MIT 1223]